MGSQKRGYRDTVRHCRGKIDVMNNDKDPAKFHSAICVVVFVIVLARLYTSPLASRNHGLVSHPMHNLLRLAYICTSLKLRPMNKHQSGLFSDIVPVNRFMYRIEPPVRCSSLL